MHNLEKVKGLLRWNELELGAEQLKKTLKFYFLLHVVNCSKNLTTCYNIYVNIKQLNLLYSDIQIQVRHQSAHFPVSFWLPVCQKSILCACTFTAG